MNPYQSRKETDARGTVRMQAPLGERQIVTELTEEIDLPDYQPEIKRLLRVQAKILPPDCYIGAGNAECSGSVAYSVLYSGADGTLWCATPTGSYRFTVPVELPADFDAGEGLTCDAHCLPETVSGRVTAPRKLTVRCRLRSRVQLWGTRILPDPVEQSPCMERLMKSCDCARMFFGTGEAFTVGDEILCDAREGDVRVISADAQVFVAEATAGSGSVDCRGEICLKLLCCHDAEGEVYSVLRRMPFSQTVDLDGVEVNCGVCATGSCRDLHVTVADGRISCEVTAVLSVRAMRNETISLLCDAYSTQADCTVSTREITVPVALRSVLGNFSVNQTVTAEEAGIRPGSRAVDADCTVTLTDVTEERGRYVLTGKCRFRLVISTGEDWSVQEIELPVRYETDGSDGVSAAVTAAESDAEAISCRARIDGEKLVLDAEISVSGVLRGAQTESVLSELTIGAPWQAPGAVYTICYPAKDDTLWSISKRYHTPVSALAAKNALAQAPAADSPDSVAGVRYLMI